MDETTTRAEGTRYFKAYITGTTQENCLKRKSRSKKKLRKMYCANQSINNKVVDKEIFAEKRISIKILFYLLNTFTWILNGAVIDEAQKYNTRKASARNLIKESNHFMDKDSKRKSYNKMATTILTIATTIIKNVAKIISKGITMLKLNEKSINNPCRSVTLKAKVENREQMESAIFQLMDTIGHVIKQEDIYFNVPYGQMKLRIPYPTSKNTGELISYKQTNNVGPNFCEFRITHVSDAQYLRTTLALSLTELGVITKRRRTYVKDSVTINLDDVDQLGCFVDIDISCDGIILTKAECLLAKAAEIQSALKIDESQLIPYSYYELFCHKQEKNANSTKACSNNSNVFDDCESGISEGGSSI